MALLLFFEVKPCEVTNVNNLWLLGEIIADHQNLPQRIRTVEQLVSSIFS